MGLLQNLQDSKTKMLTYFDLPDEDLNKSYAPDKWTVKELLHHITDAETVMYDRLRRIISEPRQVIWAFDQKAWSEHLDYKTRPLELNKQMFEAVRNSIIYLAENYYTTLGDKEFIHSQTGVRTLADEFEKVAWHCEGHLKQIEQAIGKT